jgi:hypothetical protein
MESTQGKSTHLIVLQHGLWGEHANLEFLAQLLSGATKEQGNVVSGLSSWGLEKSRVVFACHLGGNLLFSSALELAMPCGQS